MRKQVVKKILPKPLLLWFKRIYCLPSTCWEMFNHAKRLFRYSSRFISGREKALAELVIESHVLEKGITMPNRRLGFGYERTRSIISKCKEIIKEWGSESVFLQLSLCDLSQYLEVHEAVSYSLPDDIVLGINELQSYRQHWGRGGGGGGGGVNCYAVNKEDYFRETSDFKEFAKSRHSVRWFANTPVDGSKLKAAIELAQTAPSACNRQATRVKIISSEEGKKLCCELQVGNRGFGETADKWILITSELAYWSNINLHGPYVDAGIFTMNLLYALHYYGIVACTLNAYLGSKKSKKLYRKLGISESELPVVFIAIGNPTDNFMIPKSQRLSYEDIVQVV